MIKRDYVMARLAGASLKAELVKDAVSEVLYAFMDPEGETGRKQRLDLIDEALADCASLMDSLADARAATEQLRRSDLAMSEDDVLYPDGKEEDGDEGDEGGDDEEDDEEGDEGDPK